MVQPCPHSLEEVACTSVASTDSWEEAKHPVHTGRSAHRRYSVTHEVPFLWHRRRRRHQHYYSLRGTSCSSFLEDQKRREDDFLADV